MTELYVFRGTTGHAEIVTNDKSGKNLPPHAFGQWVFSRTINVAGETHLKDGFHHGRNSSLTSHRQRGPLGRHLCLPISPT